MRWDCDLCYLKILIFLVVSYPVGLIAFMGFLFHSCLFDICEAEDDCIGKKEFEIYYDRSFDSVCDSKYDCYCDNGFGYSDPDCRNDPLSDNLKLCIFYAILISIAMGIGILIIFII